MAVCAALILTFSMSVVATAKGKCCAKAKSECCKSDAACCKKDAKCCDNHATATTQSSPTCCKPAGNCCKKNASCCEAKAAEKQTAQDGHASKAAEARE